jgi:hypothetical protein
MLCILGFFEEGLQFTLFFCCCLVKTRFHVQKSNDGRFVKLLTNLWLCVDVTLVIINLANTLADSDNVCQVHLTNVSFAYELNRAKLVLNGEIFDFT